MKYLMSTSLSSQTTVTTRRGLGASWITQTRVYHFLCIESATAREEIRSAWLLMSSLSFLPLPLSLPSSSPLSWPSLSLSYSRLLGSSPSAFLFTSMPFSVAVMLYCCIRRFYIRHPCLLSSSIPPSSLPTLSRPGTPVPYSKRMNEIHSHVALSPAIPYHCPCSTDIDATPPIKDTLYTLSFFLFVVILIKTNRIESHIPRRGRSSKTTRRRLQGFL